MPKEYINNRWYGQTARSHAGCSDQGEPHCPPSCTGAEVAISEAAVKVGWSKKGLVDGYVQVAVILDRGGVADPDVYAEHSQMDRDGINHLIRTLRRARDAAFGADA